MNPDTMSSVVTRFSSTPDSQSVAGSTPSTPVGPPNRRLPVVFLHIPKAAGTTLRRVLQRQFDPRTIHHLYLQDLEEPPARFQYLPQARRAQIQLLLGHVPFGLHESLVGPATYVSMLRRPVDRIISDYFYILGNPGHVFHSTLTSSNMTLPEFAECGQWIYNDNGMVRMYAGMLTAPVGSINEEALDRAKRNIQEHFAVIGLAERFEETLMLLKHRFGWKSLYYTRENTGSYRSRTSHHSESDLSRIAHANAFDLDLYRFVEEILDAQIACMGPSFQESVRSFGALNNRLLELGQEAHELIVNHDYHGTLRAATQAIDLDPYFAPAYHHRSCAHFHLGEVDDSLAQAAVALRLDPHDRHVILHCGNLLERQVHREQARALYRFFLLNQSPYDAEIIGRLKEVGVQSNGSGIEQILSSCVRLGI